MNLYEAHLNMMNFLSFGRAILHQEVSQSVVFYDGLTGLTWLNYFGSSYLTQEDFNKPSSSADIGNGVRFNLASTPSSKELDDEAFLQKSEIQIGRNWFWPRIERGKMRIPNFIRCEITRL